MLNSKKIFNDNEMKNLAKLIDQLPLRLNDSKIMNTSNMSQKSDIYYDEIQNFKKKNSNNDIYSSPKKRSFENNNLEKNKNLDTCLRVYIESYQKCLETKAIMTEQLNDMDIDIRLKKKKKEISSFSEEKSRNKENHPMLNNGNQMSNVLDDLPEIEFEANEDIFKKLIENPKISEKYKNQLEKIRNIFLQQHIHLSNRIIQITSYYEQTLAIIFQIIKFTFKCYD